MSETIQATLTSAFEMVELGHPDRAVTLLQPLLTQAADNPDVWWVYAHAVSDPQVAHAALTRVLRLEPGYPEAVALLRRLEKQLRAQRANLMRERPAAAALSTRKVSPYDSAPAPPTDFPEMPLSQDHSGCLGGGFQVFLVLVAMGLIAVVALLALEPQVNLWLANLRQDQKQPTVTSPIIRTWVPTTVVGAGKNNATDTPIAKASFTPTTSVVLTSTQPPLITSTPPSSAAIVPELDVSALLAAVPDFELRQSELLRPASKGWNVVLPLCGTRGTAEAVQLVQDNLVKMAAASAELPETISAIAIELMDCTTNEPLSIIGVELSTAKKFAAGGMNEKALRARFHPLFEG